jgi:hypothetical protein
MPLSEFAEILLQFVMSLFPEVVDSCPSVNVQTLPKRVISSTLRATKRCVKRKNTFFVIAACTITGFYLSFSTHNRPLGFNFLHTFKYFQRNFGTASLPLIDRRTSDGFAGCIVVKDDNDRISEWIAYHWLILPLKYLVVAVDPTGKTSPRKILNLFNDTQKYDLGMEILLWDDADYGHWIDEELDEVHKHRSRQKRFLAQCQKYHKARNRTWLAVIDPDEFITYNIISDDDRDPERKNDVDAFGLIDGVNFTATSYRINMQEARRAMTKENALGQKTVFQYINEHREEAPWNSEPCYLMPRTLFSAIESPLDALHDSGVTQYGFDPNRFSTLRYFKHGEKGSWYDNHFGKVIIDLSRIDENEIVEDMRNIHVPLDSCYYPFRLYETGLLRVHHYLGSWEQYSSKSDVRRNREKFNEAAFVNYGADFQLQSWLKRFVDIVGVENSKNLLKYSGVIEKPESNLSLMEQPDYGYIRVEPP